jgi:hypothetical protein
MVIEKGIPRILGGSSRLWLNDEDTEFSCIRCLPKPFDAGTFQRHAGEVFAAA